MNLKQLKSFVLVLALGTFGLTKVSAQSNAAYVDKYSPIAKEMMEEHGVPASVILAIAMHESGNGGSRVAKNLNNHFGVKGKNNSTVIRSAYKGYRSVLDSYDDFVGIVKRKKTTQSLFEKHPGEKYEAWVKAIARSGYSTSKGWTAKVIATIKRYHLDMFDNDSKQNKFSSTKK